MSTPVLGDRPVEEHALPSRRSLLSRPARPFPPATPNRLAWVDTVKGIGIALVVYGHVHTPGLLNRFIYEFHMPLFFWISGLLHKPQQDLKGFLRKKLKHLLVPYVSFAAIAFALSTAIAFRSVFTADWLLHELYKVLWGGEAMAGLYGVLWFLPCLFFVQQTMNWLLINLPLHLVAGITFVELLVSYGQYLWAPHFNLPLDAHVVPAATPFFLAGYLCRDRKLSGMIPWLTGVLGFAGTLLLVHHNSSATYDMKAAHYGVPFLSLLLALGCIMGTVRVGMQLESSRVGRLLKQWGAASMGIMFLHKDLPAVLPRYGRIARHSAPFAFLILILLSWLGAWLLSRYRLSRILLLGLPSNAPL